DGRPLVISKTINQDLRIEFLSKISLHAASSGMDESIQKAVVKLKQSSQTLEELFDHCHDMGWVPDAWAQATPAQIQSIATRGVELNASPYFISLLPIDVHLYVAKDDKLSSDLPERFAAHVPGIRLSSILVPGAHHTMVQDPNIEQLGQRLSEAIGKVPP